MSKQLAPFHFDIVGSFLRPEELKEAREAFNNGNISREELTAVEDRLITDLIQKQKAAGLPVITDGEFRRAYWHLDFMWGFNGVKEIELEHGYKFVGQETAPGSLALTGKITGTNHPFVEHFKFVKQFEDEHVSRCTLYPINTKVAISPSFSHIFQGGYSAGYYSYKWAEVLDADAFQYFKENSIFDTEIAQKYKKLLSLGGTKNPMKLYKDFRGREPKVDSLLKRAFGL